MAQLSHSLLIDLSPDGESVGMRKMSLEVLQRLRRWGRTIKRDVHAISLAARDPRVPWYAKALAICVAGYALSPIDLIPDIIPVLGYLDDVIIVPVGILLVVWMIPDQVMAEHRATAEAAGEKPVSSIGAAAIIIIWILFAAAAGWYALDWLGQESKVISYRGAV